MNMDMQIREFNQYFCYLNCLKQQILMNAKYHSPNTTNVLVNKQLRLKTY